jgi:polyhydroxybutyrate depolymerase
MQTQKLLQTRSVSRSSLGFALLLLVACSGSDTGTTGSSGPSVAAFPNDPSRSAADPNAAPAASADAMDTDPASAGATPTASANNEGPPQIAGMAPAAPANGGETTPAATPPGDMPPGDMAPTDMTDPGAMMPPPPPMNGEQNNPTPITPSAGCGKGNPPTGQLSMTIRGNRADYLVTLPGNYSTTSPSPLIFGFHGRNRTYLEFEQVDASQIRTQLENRAVMVFPQSQGGPGWNFAAEVPPSVEFFEALYSQMLANYCVDTSHVFAIGHSSGAYFADILACRYGDRLRGIGDVSGALQERTCTGNVAAIVTHGPNDTVVAFSGGVAMRDFYLARNGCSQTTTPGPDSPCVTYQGCQPGLPVAWCQHTEPTYTDAATGRPTNHGWPSFASKAIADFLFALP